MHPEHFWPFLLQVHIDGSHTSFPPGPLGPLLYFLFSWLDPTTYWSLELFLPRITEFPFTEPLEVPIRQLSLCQCPSDISMTFFGLSAPPASLLRVHLSVTPRSVTTVLNKIVSGTECWAALLVTGHQLLSHLWHCATDANPFSPSGQTASSHFHRSLTWHALHWFVYKDAMGDDA